MWLSLVASALVGCGGGADAVAVDASPGAGDGATADAPPLEEDLELVFTPSPVADLPAGVRFTTVPYGTDGRQVMDAFLPAATAPTAVVIYFHGGGFVGGSRTSAYAGGANALRRIVGENIAWIGVDYQLLLPIGTETEGVKKSIGDSRRALQFVKRHAIAFNIDPARIGLYGSSAGAGTSLWLAFHDDLAEPTSDDPIARQSTRPRATAVIETQATYDLLRWSPDIFAPTYPVVTTQAMFSVPQLADLAMRFYGLPAASGPAAMQAAMETPAITAYRDEYDMLDLLTADDPPTYISNSGSNTTPQNPSQFDLLHHPLHARTLTERATAVSAMLVADVPAFDISTPGGAMDFLVAQLAP